MWMILEWTCQRLALWEFAPWLRPSDFELTMAVVEAYKIAVSLWILGFAIHYWADFGWTTFTEKQWNVTTRSTSPSTPHEYVGLCDCNLLWMSFLCSLVFFLCRLKPTVLWICSFEIYEILLFGFGAVVRRFCHWAHPCQTLFCQTLRWPQRLFLAEEAPSLGKLTSQKIYAATVLLKHETIESYITTVVVAWYCQSDKLITYRVLWLRTVFWTYWITHNFPHALWNEYVNPAQDLEQIPIVLDGRTHLSRLFQPNEPSTTSCSRLVGSKITWPLHVTFSLCRNNISFHLIGMSRRLSMMIQTCGWLTGWPVAGYENPGYPQSPMKTGVLSDMLRGAAIALVEHKPNQQQHIQM